MGAARSAEEIRRSVEANRAELGESLQRLRVEVDKATDLATDWRSALRRNQRPLLIGAGVAGFVLGGGIGAITNLIFGRPGRRSSDDEE